MAESTLKSAPAPVPEEVVDEESVAEPVVETAPAPEPQAVQTIIPEEPSAESSLAQVSGTDSGLFANPLLGAVITGLAILLGLVIGSKIIASALRKS